MSALAYAARGWRIFPCNADRLPLIDDWPNRASRNQAKIARWWRHWPRALIGCLTGAANGFNVLDVDVKRAGAYGFDTLADLGFAVLPTTPIAHTRSGGVHLYFDPAGQNIHNTAGARGRGIGFGLDWRGDGGFVALPSAGSGYWWDPHCNFDTVALAPVPPELLPRAPAPGVVVAPVKPTTGLSPYADAALDSACRNIIAAPAGSQHDTLIRECFAIGGLAGAAAIPADFAHDALLWAARQMPAHDPTRPWHEADLQRQVGQSFDYGRAHPRGGGGRG